MHVSAELLVEAEFSIRDFTNIMVVSIFPSLCLQSQP